MFTRKTLVWSENSGEHSLTINQAWDFSADPRISADFDIKKKKKLTLECIKTAVFDTRNPKSPYRGRGTSPPPTPPTRSLRSLNARSIRSLAKLSSSFFKYFLSHACINFTLERNRSKQTSCWNNQQSFMVKVFAIGHSTEWFFNIFQVWFIMNWHQRKLNLDSRVTEL